ncbi:MAG: SusC/RagA family TonB-linked outer membrane protein [Prevotellaceae bacterium]|jgi:TonB-linked SusC/RagA family outer membrane protein|nr:SusC/RagA family TonB-linked outer membrane protein [Prevotellaceae bacterium]
MNKKITLMCLLLLFTGVLLAQNLTIRGNVIDEVSQPLIGATVMVKGTKQIANADLNGNYSLSNVPSNATLVFSFVGYKTKEEAVNGRTQINVQLLLDATALEGAIVTGYQTIDRRLFTGSVAVLKAESALIDGVADVSRSLQGKAAGVYIQNVSGTFGASPKLRIRGASTIYGNQKPLWVIDGIPLEEIVDVSPDDLSSGNAETLISSAIAGLNADDIETFQILRDASASSIYGARAMNGVIVITTKKGKSGSMRINYTGEFTVRAKPSYNNFNILNSQEQMAIYKEMEDKGWLNYASTSRSSSGGIFRKMYDLISTWDETNGQFGLQNTPEARAKFLQQYEKINTDWFNILFKNSLQQNHSLSISAGSNRARFYGSISYFGDEGWSIRDKVQRFTGNTNASFDVNKYVTISLLTNTSIRMQEAPGSLDRRVNTVEGTFIRDFDTNPYSYALNTSRAARPYDEKGNLEYYIMNYAPFNILNELDNNILDVSMFDTKVQGQLDIKPMRGLEISAIGSFRYVRSSREHKIMDNSNYAMSFRANEDYYINDNNRRLYKDPDNINLPSIVVLPFGGFYNRYDDVMPTFYERTMAIYNIDWLGDHLINILAGQEVRSTDRTRSNYMGVGYQWERGGVPYIDYHAIKQMIEGGNDYFSYAPKYDRFSSFFSKLTYGYAGKYVANATLRYDGSNQLGRSTQARWMPSWSLSGQWNAHNESFLQDSKIISQLVVRLGHSVNGNMPGNVSNALAVFMNDVKYRPKQSEMENMIVISQLENSELTWEKQKETSLGFDLGLLSNRISLITDIYSKQGFDLIGNIRTSGIGGQMTKRINYANMKSRGIEFTLNTRNVVLKDFSWTSNFVFAYNKNEITNLEARPRVIDLVVESGYPREGYPQRSMFSIPFMGLDEEGLPLVTNESGQITVGNVNFQETINTGYLIYEGPIDPPYTGGFENSFRYKNLRLSVYLNYQYGNVIRLDNAFARSYSDLTAMPKEFMDRWIRPGDEAFTTIPVIASVGQNQLNSRLAQAYNAYNYSTERVASGSFIRLKDVTLSYDFPKKLISVAGVESLQLRCVASNLTLLYADKKLKGQDPEFFKSGGVAMPVPRQITFSVRIGF